ncbi:MAG: DNA mismatch repair protein MutS [Clostridia bacterium 41_269]|nr:MAG: DNA mismatch repair protein MutS [Clostridia bacterium 41_269]
MGELTPMMRQYFEIKEQYKDAILFFRLGDFYEMFLEDALKASKVLKITLTSREVGKGKKVPMCGVPFHSASSYIAKLIENGFKVAICEQVSDPSQSRGLVKREVVKVITPGTVIDAEMLDAKSNNYIVSLVFFSNNYGLSFADVSTGSLKVTEFDADGTDKLFSEIIRINPSEFVVSDNFTSFKLWDDIREKFPKSLVNIVTFKKDSFKVYKETLIKHFKVVSLKSFGCEHMNAGIAAAGILLNYLQNVQKASLRHFLKIVPYQAEAYMMLDPSTRKHLDLTSSKSENEKFTLQHVLDKTRTAMGSRFLKNMIELPLRDEDEINLRLEAVEEFKNNTLIRKKLFNLLYYVYDLERLISKISYGNATPKDLINLKDSLKQMPEIKLCISQCGSRKIKLLRENLRELPEIVDTIEKAIVDDPPSSVGEGNIFKPGYSSEIDELRNILKNSKQWILNLEQKERERTGIKSLKIKFNKVFGYFIEVTKANIDAVPEDYIRKQTLVNCERYIQTVDKV